MSCRGVSFRPTSAGQASDSVLCPLPDTFAELARNGRGSMRQVKTDRRSLRTRQLLMQAMVELMRTRRYDAITVLEITEQANVGRSTFYAHFTDKDDLLVDGVQRMLASLDRSEPKSTGRKDFYPTLALFQHVGTQAELYRVMSRGRGLTLFLAALHD